MMAIAFALLEETPTFTSGSGGGGEGGQQGEIRNAARQRQNGGKNGRVHEDKERLSKWHTIEKRDGRRRTDD